MNFSQVWIKLKEGFRLRRIGWKPGRFIYFDKGNEYEYSHYRLSLGNGMSVAWFPNRCDLLEEDWQIY